MNFEKIMAKKRRQMPSNFDIWCTIRDSNPGRPD